MEDEKIIALFFSRSEQAIVQTDKKYGKTCKRIAYNILNNRQDAEECVNDTYMSMWNLIPPESPNPLSAFLYKVVRNVSLKRYRYNTAEKRNSRYDLAMSEIENDVFLSDCNIDEEIDAKSLTGLIEQFLDGLSRENRVIFMRRYWFSDSYREIAQRAGITEKNVSVRLTRIRKQLYDYLKEKGVFL